MKCGIVLDRRYLNHNMGDFHPESPKRIETIHRIIERKIAFPFLKIEPRTASEAEIQWIHTRSYLDSIKRTAGKEKVKLDPDTSTGPESYQTALLAAGGILKSIDLIMEGKIKNCFAPVRPPGHHAEATRAMGFCLFNNIAIGAEYLLRKHQLKKILIIDWDIHHGNGTQNAFYQRNDVLYFSIHQSPHYPGTGHWSETGIEKGEGFNFNVPLLTGKTDKDFLYIFKSILEPLTAAFKPEFILVSAGFDIAASDPLGSMDISPLGFGALARELLDLAGLFSQERILFALEGGYDLKALEQGVVQVLLQMNGEVKKPDIQATATPEIQNELLPVFENLKEYLPKIRI